MQRAALHAHKAGSAADIAPETIDLGQQILALERFAGLTQGQRGQRTGQNNTPRFIGLLLFRRKFPRLDRAGAIAQNQHALYKVFQLTHISGPGHRLQQGDRFVGHLAHRQALGFVALFNEVLRQNRDVLAPLFQAGHRNRHHVQTVIQLFAEAVRGDFIIKILVGRRHDPQINPYLVTSANPLELLIDQHT